MMLLQI
jgi:hypothetical protein